MSKRRDILTCFLRDVALHTLQIHRDDGLYRHLRFKRPGTNAYYFDIVTWPGYLTITGDMGTWTFSRVSDMFNFFMDSHFGHRASFVINPGYWSEKFEAGAGRSRRNPPAMSSTQKPLMGLCSNGWVLIWKTVTTKRTGSKPKSPLRSCAAMIFPASQKLTTL
ncbi:Uncharacterised protein [Cedecea neteri]|uniref:Uncharacterized protein n=1 Tax=Cedecea neteri TaxID=158822 RepID=A0A2X3JBX8_9ENTR|nr:Uncharacterised protein [Cedecea neteri]